MLRMHAQKRNRTFHEPWRAGSVHLAQPFQGCEDPSLPTQGSLGPSRTGQHSATLGFEAESLWDSRLEKVHGFKERKFLSGKALSVGPLRGRPFAQQYHWLK